MNSGFEEQTQVIVLVDMAASKDVNGFAKGLMGFDIMRFKFYITLYRIEFISKYIKEEKVEEEILHILSATKLAKIKEKIFDEMTTDSKSLRCFIIFGSAPGLEKTSFFSCLLELK